MTAFDPRCRQCPRLVAHLQSVGQQYPDYHCAPVAPFGAADARLLIVGLAPGMHGANATGRPFTGDYAGILLYRTLHEFGFASAPESVDGNDGLQLYNCRITNAVKCLPPENKPTGSEISRCRTYLTTELQTLPAGALVLALGGIAHRSVLAASGLVAARHPFGHEVVYALPGGRRLLTSYHCSRYNTQTRRLTEAMFRQVFARARSLLDTPAAETPA